MIVGGYHAAARGSRSGAAAGASGRAGLPRRVSAGRRQRTAAGISSSCPTAKCWSPAPSAFREPMAHWPRARPELLLVPLLAFDARATGWVMAAAFMTAPWRCSRCRPSASPMLGKKCRRCRRQSRRETGCGADRARLSPNSGDQPVAHPRHDNRHSRAVRASACVLPITARRAMPATITTAPARPSHEPSSNGMPVR